VAIGIIIHFADDFTASAQYHCAST